MKLSDLIRRSEWSTRSIHNKIPILTLNIFFVFALPSHKVLGNDLTRSRPIASAKSQNLKKSAAAVTIERIDIDQTAIPNGIPTNVRIQAMITGEAVIENGVAAQVVDDEGRRIRALGTLRDDGIGGDITAMDNIYTRIFPINEPSPGDLRIQISVAVKNSLLRTVSDPFYIYIRSDVTVFNIDRDLWAGNLGPNGVLIYFGGDIPPGTQSLKLLRAPHGSESWETVLDVVYDTESFTPPLYDRVDGSLGMFDYKLQLLDLSGVILKEFEKVTIPRYIDDSPDKKME
ncbi:MAG: choice-of-anchor X domain-containing protein [Gammaproteobacteria bacterium]